ncbi:hypothetical protein DFH08DRAFT_854743 [Mycena albidolilacea]|uniref:DUF6534 domain-containing protein n=1 Tax=Mycena albidolilacea TaxID=1033008 RepID=A0AAD7ACW5_9AGAR|nr:hypothetical protein DFH08DRAFT_854743 [Mycena albidolilacea]
MWLLARGYKTSVAGWCAFGAGFFAGISFLSLFPPFSSTFFHFHSIMAGVDLLFGPMLIGVVLNMILYGVVCIQTFTYFQRYPNDSAWIRCFMMYLIVVETANVVVELGIIYEPLIIHYGKAAALAISPTLLPGDPVLISVVSAPIQIFTAWRMSVITGSLILPALITLLSFGSFGSGIIVSINVFMHPEFRSFETFTTEVIVWLVLSAVCDVVITAGMTHALYSRKTGFSVVDGQINRIIRLTLETGALTAITALVDMILFLVFPRTTVNFIVDFPLSALYTCSILAMLNSRQRRKTTDAENTHTVPRMLIQDQTTLRPRSFHSSKKSQANVEIHMQPFTEKPLSLGHAPTASESTLVSNLDTDLHNYRRTPDVARPRKDSGDPTSQNSHPHPQPDFYGYNRSPRARARTLSNGAATQRSLPSNPRPNRPTVPKPQQLGLRPKSPRAKTIIATDRPSPERF